MENKLEHMRYRARFYIAGKFALPGSFPTHIDLELSGKCQLACIMCPYGTGDFDESKQGMMPWDMCEDAIRQAAMGGAKSIKFNFRGEPGLSRNLVRAVALAKEQGVHETSINTNLTAFSHRRLNELAKAGLDLMIISVDGATSETYEKIREGGNWGKLISNFVHLNYMPRKPRIRIQFVEQEGNRHEVEKFKVRFSHFADELVVQQVRESNQGKRVRCPQPYQRLIVAWDGKVFACCSNWANEWPVGQFPDASLSAIWCSNSRLFELRKRSTKFNDNPCRDCTVGVSYK